MDFGKLFHGSMHALYRPLLGRPLGEGVLRDAQEEAPQLVERIVAKAYGLEDTPPEGEPLLLQAVLLRYLRRVIDLDIDRSRQLPGLCIRHLEHKVGRHLPIKTSTGLHNFYIWGRADRIDEAQGTYYLIDYKTGKESPKYLPPEKVFQIDYEGKHASTRQLALYAWICGLTPKKKTEVLLLSLPKLHNQPPKPQEYREKELQKPLSSCLEGGSRYGKTFCT